jgi:hypothetical protein
VQACSDEGSEHPIDDGGAQSSNPDAHSGGGKKGHYFYCLDFFDIYVEFLAFVPRSIFIFALFF